MPHPERSTVFAGRDEQDNYREAGTNWLLHRAGVKVEPSALNGNPFRGASLLDLARHRLEARGIDTRGQYGNDIATRAASLSTSDFPILMQDVAHKMMAAAYTTAAYVWRRFCAVGRVNDFRPHNRYRVGGFGNLEEVTEGGMLRHGSISDAEREVLQAKTKGKIITLTRQMIVNDDLNTFHAINKAMGQAAARTVENDVFTLLASNPALSDGVPLFHASHGNLKTDGAAPTTAGFDGVRAAMARQVDVGGNDFIDLRPAVWLGPIEHGGQARVVNDAKYDTDAEGVLEKPNSVRGQFRDIVDTPRLTGNLWYAFADPEQESTLEVAFLQGEETPKLESKDGFEFDGISWRVLLDYAVGAVGYRGAQKVVW